jgi:AraC-like DNA-binding protein
MKPVLFTHPEVASDSFFVLQDRGPHFYDQLHYHPMLQITYITEGEGTFFIADKMERFGPGDLYLIGANLPHVFRNDNEYYNKKSNKNCEYVSIYFNEDAFGQGFFRSSPLKELEKLWSDAERGIKIMPDTEGNFKEMVYSILHAADIDRFIRFVSLLNAIHSVPRRNRKVLATHGFVSTNKAENSDAMSEVFNYVMKNFKKEIKLDEMASRANMSRAAFCRYFKKRTQKSLIEFVLEIRIGYACRLLQEERLSISEIAYDCGFKNLSNFNRQFKCIMNKTPREYIRFMKESLTKKNKMEKIN